MYHQTAISGTDPNFEQKIEVFSYIYICLSIFQVYLCVFKTMALTSVVDTLYKCQSRKTSEKSIYKISIIVVFSALNCFS